MAFAKKGVAAEALKLVSDWEKEHKQKMRQVDEALKWEDWFNKFLEKGIYEPRAGQTQTCVWRISQEGLPVLRSVGFTSVSLNLTTYMWTSLDSISTKSSIDTSELSH